MTLETVEHAVRLAGAAAASFCLAVVLIGIARGQQRRTGRTTGAGRRALGGPVLVAKTVLFFGACFLLWHPLGEGPAPSVRTLLLAAGAVLLFSGLGLLLWARLVLGEMYNVSSSAGVRLYADHRLVTSGPFALVRHPMYVGLIVASAGGLVLYRTWTLVATTGSFLALAFRARREEQALADEFGEEWEEYRRRVPAWMPRIRRRDE